MSTPTEIQTPTPPTKPAKVLAAGYDAGALAAFVAKIGLEIHETRYGPQSKPVANPVTHQVTDHAAESSGLVFLSEYGVIELAGVDAISFLQGQVTNDVTDLVDGGSCLAAFCTAKGRTLASFWILRQSAEQLFLITARDLAAGLARRLSMFVLRAKCKVLNLSNSIVVLGQLNGAHGFAQLDAIAASTRTEANQLLWSINLPDGRAMRLMPATEFEKACQADPLLTKKLSSSTDWRYADCLAGLPFICAENSELFVPQMINFELIGGVNFKKGCYPGQEIVARSHYLGKNKLRMLLGFSATELTPGTDVIAEPDSAPIGQVVMSALGSDGRALVLFQTNVEQARQAQRLQCENQTIVLTELPYDVPAAKVS